MVDPLLGNAMWASWLAEDGRLVLIEDEDSADFENKLVRDLRRLGSLTFILEAKEE